MEDFETAYLLNELMLKLYRVWFLLGGIQSKEELQYTLERDDGIMRCKLSIRHLSYHLPCS